MPAPDSHSTAEEMALLARAAEDAGRIALRYWRHQPKAWEKPDEAGPVSEADLAVDAALKVALREARPGHGWLSEETPDDPARLDHARVFIIDPIDGTRAFLAGEEAFALSLAVAERGVVIAAVVHLPARGLTYAAHQGGPALLNGKPIHASRRAVLEGAEILSNKASLSPDLWPGTLPEVKRGFRASLAWRFCLAAEGRFDAMATLRDTWEWDSAAGSLIAERAGCRVTDGEGMALRFNQRNPKARGILVAPPALHDALMAARLGPDQTAG